MVVDNSKRGREGGEGNWCQGGGDRNRGHQREVISDGNDEEQRERGDRVLSSSGEAPSSSSVQACERKGWRTQKRAKWIGMAEALRWKMVILASREEAVAGAVVTTMTQEATTST